jgi:hypothetical protein
MAALRTLALAAALLAGCSPQIGQVVIGVASDLPADAIDTITMRLTKGGVELTHQSWPSVLPGTLVLDSNAKQPPTVEIELTGLKSGAAVVQRGARLRPILERTLFVRLALVQACAGMACPDGQGCVEGACAPLDVDPLTLLPYTGGEETSASCASSAVLLDETDRPLPPATDGGCAPEQRCVEETCYAVTPGSAPGPGTLGGATFDPGEFSID